MPNRLADETSPYLLQHAHNPVNWYPWGDEAFARAKAENKPIFLSIGYAACHWCHVMAHESFEDSETAGLMNENFINIKVDREERPDVDAIYMQATVAMTGSGGWPMSVFLTPDLKPFYAGTYFPPAPRHNMPSFKDLLAAIARTWKEQRAEATRVGNEVSSHLQQALSAAVPADSGFTRAHLDAAVKSVLESYDWGYGGWGSAPKFPQPMTIEFLLRGAATKAAIEDIHLPGKQAPEASPEKKNSENSASSVADATQTLQPALHALRAMARGGMYDVVGGGFSRYSTDNFWRVPHFEKMLYDNAQLAQVYLHAWQLTGDPYFRRIVTETLDFIAREMTHPDGGFYSSLDADSEGEEGKFYAWTLEEIRAVLAEDLEFFEAAYGVTARGNWEGKTVLQRALDDASLAARFKLPPEAVPAKLAECHSRLLTARSTRVRPGTDDKVLASWNGLMLATVAQASRMITSQASDAEQTSNSNIEIASGTIAARNDKYYVLATHNAEFLLSALRPDGKLRHSWRAGKTTNEVFLEDYGALILGLLELYQTDFNEKWFKAARELAEEMIDLFADPAGGFFDTSREEKLLLLRPKDVQDNATPSGNALACEALLKLAAFTDEGQRYRDLAEKALGLVVGLAVRYPTSFGRWLSAADFALGNTKQVAVVYAKDGAEAAEFIGVVRSAYRPNTILAVSAYPPSNDAPALLRERPLKDGKATAYVCEGFVCKNPVTRIPDLKELL